MHAENVSARAFVAETATLQVDILLVRVNTKGGSVPDALAIYNALRRQLAAVVSRVEGVAASCASLGIGLATCFAEDVMPVAATGGWPILRKPYTQAELAASLQTAMAAKRTLKSSGEPASG